MRVAVVGHVEWVEFARVARVPVAGEIAHARCAWEEPGGGGAVAAMQLAKLAGGATLFTALGDDELGRRAKERLEAMGLRVQAAIRKEPQRRAFTFVDDRAERTITVLGERLAPRRSDPLGWDELERADAVYFTAGDAAALKAARRARVLVATPRAREVLEGSEVRLDALVGSGSDAGERYAPGELQPAPALAVATAGPAGGSFRTEAGEAGSFAAAPLPGPPVDAYGCGDSFAAALTYALGARLPVPEALALAARCGAACLAGRGPYAGQLARTDL